MYYTPRRVRLPSLMRPLQSCRLLAMVNAAGVRNRKDTTRCETGTSYLVPYCPPVGFRVMHLVSSVKAMRGGSIAKQVMSPITMDRIRNVRGECRLLPCGAPQMSWRAICG